MFVNTRLHGTITEKSAVQIFIAKMSNSIQSPNLTGVYKNLWEYTHITVLSELHMKKDKYV